jgi:nucleotide-binding universal stress UspA family protein
MSLRSLAVAIDGSEGSQRALEQAVDLAKASGASLSIVAVVPKRETYGIDPQQRYVVRPEEQRFLTEVLSRAQQFARTAGVASVRTELMEGPIVDQLLSFLEDRRPDLVVLGARGISATRRLFLGSVSEAILHHAHGSVLIVRPPEKRSRT